MDISIVIPVFNSEASLQELYDRLVATLTGQDLKFEVICVDDASSDGSWDKLIAIKKEAGDKLTAVRLKRNYGQHNAIVCGLTFARGKLVVTMDDDLQHPPEEIPKLIQRQAETGAELVYGLYKTRQHGKVRSMGSYLVRRSSKYVSENELAEGSSFRLFTATLSEKIKRRAQTFMYIDEVIHWYTSDIEAVEVEHHPRKAGKSSYSFFKLTSLTFKILVNYTALPLKLMIYGGSILALISFILGVFFIIKRFYYNVEVEGFTALIVTILFSTSLMLICFGIVGQYLNKMYNAQNGKPPYTVKKVL